MFAHADDQRLVQQTSLVQIVQQRRVCEIERGKQQLLHSRIVILVSVPRSVGELAEAIPEHGYKPAACLNQASSGQTGLTEQGDPVTLAQFHLLTTNVQCFAQAIGRQQRHCELLLSVHLVHARTVIAQPRVAVEVLQQRTTQAKPFHRNLVGQFRVARQPEPAARRCPAEWIPEPLRLSDGVLWSDVQTLSVEVRPERIVLST